MEKIMTKKMDMITQAIHKQSRLLMELEVIDAADLIMGPNGYKAVPDDFVGKTRLNVGVDLKPRRWWNMEDRLKEGQS